MTVARLATRLVGLQSGGRLAATARVALVGTLLYLLARPFLALAHELLTWGTAEAFRAVGTAGAAATLSGGLPFDPVYTNTLFFILSDIEVHGIAVAPPLGELLASGLPGAFVDPYLRAEGVWASAVIAPGASVLARMLVDLAVDVAFLLLGFWLVTLGRRAGHRAWRGRARLPLPELAVSGALLQAHVLIHHVVASPPTLAELEASGLTYGFSVLFPGPAWERPSLALLLAGLAEPLRLAVLCGLGLVGTYGLALGCWQMPRLATRGVDRLRRAGATVGHVRHSQPVPGLAGLACFAVAVMLTPLGNLADASSLYLGDAVADEIDTRHASLDPLAAGREPAPTVMAAPVPAETPVAASRVQQEGPTRVVVSGVLYSYTYTVAGQPQVIRGMGYNPMYARLPLEARLRLYDRDFAMMRDAGVNTVLGWTTHEFDRALLDKAHEYGLGVIVPYHLDPELDYTDPEVRAIVARDVLAWVAAYKDHPAVRMWGIGNEVLHKLVFPSWMNRRADERLEARADAFAAFLVDLMDRAHALDPDHPVTHRDAEEAYLPRLRDALTRDGVRRPWFVYGINIYTPRLKEVMANWPKMGLDVALLISEFGPGGAGPSDRPRGYREMWSMIRANAASVLGGAPYVWFTTGPEEVDRVFGLVDPEGRPVDGSLTTIGRMYRGDQGAEQTAGTGGSTVAQVCDRRVLSLARQTIRGLQTDYRSVVFQASTPPSIMGPLDNLPPDPLRSEDFHVERSDDPARRVWSETAGYSGEWWVSWSPPSRPGQQFGLLVRERAAALEVAYVYNGPGSPSASATICPLDEGV